MRQIPSFQPSPWRMQPILGRETDSYDGYRNSRQTARRPSPDTETSACRVRGELHRRGAGAKRGRRLPTATASGECHARD